MLHLKRVWTIISDFIRFIENMGWRYVGFRIGYEIQKRTGILKIRFPKTTRVKALISRQDWQNQKVNFFFNDAQMLAYLNIGHCDQSSLVERVKDLQQNKLLFFNSRKMTVKDWLTNPLNGFCYDPSQHWSGISDFSNEAGDIKFVWEKSRFTFLYDLIRYDLYFEKDHSEFVFAEIESWIDSNPVNCGPNWRCSQEITLRVLNWTYALHYYKHSKTLTDHLFSQIINSIHLQMQHVANNISYSRISVRNNHALTETLGLYLVGLLYPFFEESSTWKTNGKKWFEHEIVYQLYEDGTFLQFSINYHRVVVQLLTWGIRLAHLNNETWSNIVYDRARKSIHFLHACQDKKTGQLPNYGNNDGALFFPATTCHFRDYRPQLLALASILGLAMDYGNGAWEEESVLLGINPLKTSQKVAEEEQVFTFPDGGYFILRDGKTITFLRNGSYQNRPFQSDNMHLDIWIDGENILRDAGSFQYHTESKWIKYFSGTASHNTVMLGGYDQMRKGPRFIWFDWIYKSHGNWQEDGNRFVFDGWFEGFKNVGKNIVHRRKVTKVKAAFHWIIEDWIENAPSGIEMHQIWHPSDIFFGKFEIKSSLINGEEILFSKTRGWYSASYGDKELSHRIVFSTVERYIRTEITIKHTRSSCVFY